MYYNAEDFECADKSVSVSNSLGSKITITPGGDATWMELLDLFIDTIHGLGYILNDDTQEKFDQLIHISSKELNEESDDDSNEKSDDSCEDDSEKVD